MSVIATVRSVARPLIIAVLMASFAVVSTAAPSMADGSTHRVDDDGLAGSDGCGSSHPAFATIQSAIDASGTNDTILVCPGTYQEELSIRGARDGLTIRSTRLLGAVVLTPTEFVSIALVDIRHVTDVTIERFSLEALTEPPCTEVGRMVAITNGSRGTVLRDTRILARGTDTTGPCGYDDGVLLHTNASVRVTDSVILDFRLNGILLAGSSTRGTIVGNSIAVDSPGLLGDPSRRGVVVDGGRAIIADNHVSGGVELTPAGTPQLSSAIVVTNGHGDSTIVRDNRIRRAAFGIAISSADGVIVRNNDLRHGVYGITAGASSDDRIIGNRVRGFDYGTFLASTSAGIVIRDNDLTGNMTFDCYDESSGTGTAGTANTWVDNLGDTDSPDGICPLATP